LICHNPAFEIMFMATGSAHDLVDALHVETTTIYYVVKLADQMGVGCVQFESDSLMVHQAVRSVSHGFAPLGQPFREIKFKLSSYFNS
jgi:hypothetical protein